MAAGLSASGSAAALALTRLIESLLYGIEPSGPLTFAVAALMLAGIAALASLAPALRAARIAPADALLEEA